MRWTLLLAISGCASVGAVVDDAEPPPDFDGDGIPDAQDPDADGDGVPDTEDPFVDLDGDGFDRFDDCDDTNPAVNPGASEICGNGLDDDCDGSAGACRVEGVLDPDDAAARVRGDESGDGLGCHVDLIGDVDGDGSSDLLLGASNAGVAWRFAGAEEGSLRAASASQRWSGDSPDFARSVVGGLDVTGDGLPDVVLTEPSWSNQERTGVGRVFLQSAVGTGDEALQVVGASAQDQLGAAAHVLGDVNRDGVDDLWVIQAGEPVLVTLPERTAVVRPSLRLRTRSAVGPLSLPEAGDVNGDGDTDLLVQRPGDGREGILFVEPPLGLLLDRDADVLSVAGSGPGRPAVQVTGGIALGDVNGDGYDDAIVGRGGFYYTPRYEGVVRIAFGNGKAAMDQPDVTIEAVDQRAPFGGLLEAGDLDLDGRADLVFSVDGSDLVVFYELSESGTLTIDDWDALLPSRPDFAPASVDIAPSPNDDFTTSLAVGYPKGAGLVALYRFGGL